jgi:hypothetical protein
MQQQPAMRTHTPEEEAETEWTRRQRLVENIANKQQQCRLIEDQGRQCSRTRPLTPECTDLLKMQIACYGYPFHTPPLKPKPAGASSLLHNLLRRHLQRPKLQGLALQHSSSHTQRVRVCVCGVCMCLCGTGSCCVETCRTRPWSACDGRAAGRRARRRWRARCRCDGSRSACSRASGLTSSPSARSLPAPRR